MIITEKASALQIKKYTLIEGSVFFKKNFFYIKITQIVGSFNKEAKKNMRA